MTAPTFVQLAVPASNWGVTAAAATRTTAAFTATAGNMLVVVAASENGNYTEPGPPVSSGLTFTSQVDIGAAGFDCGIRVWTAPVGSTGSRTVALTCGGTGSRYWGFDVYEFSGSDGIGAVATILSSAALSVGITTLADNSALVCVNGDFNAVDGASRTWLAINDAAIEKDYFRNAVAYGVYTAYWADAGAAGAKTVGLSAPSGQRIAMAAIEVKGASAPYSPPAWDRRTWRFG